MLHILLLIVEGSMEVRQCEFVE
jgi:hypothetical protein